MTEYINDSQARSAIAANQTRLLHHQLSTSQKTMIMLTGIKAFEARWQLLKGTHTSAADKHLLMQSMGRLVDNYATQDEIIRELPATLQGVFSRLVDAYLNGHWLEDNNVPMSPAVSRNITPAMLEAKQRRQSQHQQPTVASEAATYIIRERARIEPIHVARMAS